MQAAAALAQGNAKEAKSLLSSAIRALSASAKAGSDDTKRQLHALYCGRAEALLALSPPRSELALHDCLQRQ